VAINVSGRADIRVAKPHLNMLVCRRTYLKVATLQYHKGKEKSSGSIEIYEIF